MHWIYHPPSNCGKLNVLQEFPTENVMSSLWWRLHPGWGGGPSKSCSKHHLKKRCSKMGSPPGSRTAPAPALAFSENGSKKTLTGLAGVKTEMFKGTFYWSFGFGGFRHNEICSTKLKLQRCWRIQFESVLRLLNLKSVRAKNWAGARCMWISRPWWIATGRMGVANGKSS